MRDLFKVFWMTLSIVLPTPGVVAQLLGPASRQNLELVLQPQGVHNGVPEAFTIVLVNRTDLDVRVPIPSMECGDVPHGTVWLSLNFRSSTLNQPEPGRGCVKDFSYSPISERINQWKVLHPRERLVLAMVNARALVPAAGSYDYWAHYYPPGAPEADREWLRKAGIEYPKEELDSSHVKFVIR